MGVLHTRVNLGDTVYIPELNVWFTPTAKSGRQIQVCVSVGDECTIEVLENAAKGRKQFRKEKKRAAAEGKRPESLAERVSRAVRARNAAHDKNGGAAQRGETDDAVPERDA